MRLSRAQASFCRSTSILRTSAPCAKSPRIAPSLLSVSIADPEPLVEPLANGTGVMIVIILTESQTKNGVPSRSTLSLRPSLDCSFPVPLCALISLVNLRVEVVAVDKPGNERFLGPPSVARLELGQSWKITTWLSSEFYFEHADGEIEMPSIVEIRHESLDILARGEIVADDIGSPFPEPVAAANDPRSWRRGKVGSKKNHRRMMEIRFIKDPG